MEAVNVQQPEDWNSILRSLPEAHLLQTWQWSQVKAPLGWQPLPFVWRDHAGNIQAAALILQRRLALPGLGDRLNLMYIPRGPLLDWANDSLVRRVIDDLQAFAHQEKSIALKIDPDVAVGTGLSGNNDSPDSPGNKLVTALRSRGWLFSNDQVQFRNTVLIDLGDTEAAMLARMRQKTRYNIHLAQRKGVTIRKGELEDLPLLYKMYAETSVRDGFVIRDWPYYARVWQTFIQAEMVESLIAEVGSEPIAGLLVFRFGSKAWYLYGMSRNLHREAMPNYLLQWEAMRYCKSAGAKIYDLWGAPDEFTEEDPMWGVFKFKEGLGGYVLRTPGAWDYPARPGLYRLYTQTLPRLLAIMRWRGKAKTRRETRVI